jgi:hypothetical protein
MFIIYLFFDINKQFLSLSDDYIGFREFSSLRSETKGKILRNTVAF